jgi:GNAT superfamily N-acetyltransferase
MNRAAIRHAAGESDIALARALFLEYQQRLGVSLCFQGFDRELAALPGAYAPPRGRLLLAGTPGTAFGCIALRSLDETTGEVKRLYVKEQHRGEGWGRKLIDAILSEAREAGYRRLRLDTLHDMQAARALYGSVGFVPCTAYYDNPLPGVAYMERAL